MIQTKQELKFYLMADRMMNKGGFTQSLLGRLKDIIAPDFIMRYFQRRPYIEGNVVIVEYNPIDQTMLIEKGEWLENDEITKKILKLQGREVKNMGFTIKDLKELIKDAPDDLPVEVIGRYVGEENMVMTDVGIDDKSLWFELGYEFDQAGYLR